MIENSDQSAGQTRTTVVSVAAAALLVVLKLGTGLVSGSLGACLGGHRVKRRCGCRSADAASQIRLAIRPADEDHPYGHRRAENLAALGEAAILAGGGSVVRGRGDRPALPVRGIASRRTGTCSLSSVSRCVVDASRVLVSARSAAALPVGGAALERFPLRR